MSSRDQQDHKRGALVVMADQPRGKAYWWHPLGAPAVACVPTVTFLHNISAAFNITPALVLNSTSQGLGYLVLRA